jgi:hypothetical protein
MKKGILVLLTLGLAITACKDQDADVAAPSMKILSFSPQPVSGEICGEIQDTVFVVTGGEAIDLELLFSDDVALSQYKIDIHHNFDCHGHGGGAGPGISLPDVPNQTEDWTVLEVVNLSGKEQIVNRTLPVPANVTAGAYHFFIQVIDEAGNDNPFANFYAIQAWNAADKEAPQIIVDEPTQSSFSIAKCAPIAFKGRVIDNFSLSQGGNGVLFLTYTDLQSGNTFNTNAVFPFDSSVDKEFEFDFNYTVPSTLRTGAFRFSLRAFDGVHNSAESVDFSVNVTN